MCTCTHTDRQKGRLTVLTTDRKAGRQTQRHRHTVHTVHTDTHRIHLASHFAVEKLRRRAGREEFLSK